MPPTTPTLRSAHVILNVRSGTATAADVAERIGHHLQAHGLTARIDLVHSGDELSAAVARAGTGEADVVIAGGGDGTIAAVASAVVGTRSAFGVLPLGTFNYFARRFDIPIDVDGALAVITGGTIEPIAVGEVNGRIFLNNSSIGLYPAVLQQRETTYRKLGRSRAVAYLSVALLLLQPPAFLNLRLTADGRVISRRTPLLFVGANAHQLTTFEIPGEACLQSGRLAVTLTRPLSAWRLGRLAIRAFFRGLHGARELEVLCAGNLVVSLRRRRVRVAMDGEVAVLESPLHYRLIPGALRVLVPARAGEPAG